MLCGLVSQELFQLLLAGELVGVGGPHAVVRLDHNGIAHFLDEFFAARKIVYHVVAGGGNARFLVVFFHLALVLDAGHVLGLETGGDVEIGTQGSVPLQPVLVVGFQPVDAAVLERKERHRAVNLIVIFQVADFVVLVQALFQLRLQLVIGLVADAQHVHPVVFQLPAELPVVGGEVRRNENKVLHGFFLIPLSSVFLSIKAALPSPSPAVTPLPKGEARSACASEWTKSVRKRSHSPSTYGM